MTKTITILVGVILIIGVGGLVFWQTQDSETDDDTTTSAPSETTNPGTTQDTGAAITAAQIATHTDRTSCWSSINGNVYDLTSWIPKHPGGEQAIVQLCGTDGSAKFNAQHGGSPLQAKILAGFKIGTLSK